MEAVLPHFSIDDEVKIPNLEGFGVRNACESLLFYLWSAPSEVTCIAADAVITVLLHFSSAYLAKNYRV